MLLAAVLLFTGITAGAQAFSLYFREVAKDGKIYLFNSDKQYRQFLADGQLAGDYIVTLPAYGPQGEEVVSENQLAVDIYNIKHDKEPSAPPPEPALGDVPGVVTRTDPPASTQLSDHAYIANNENLQLYMTLDTVGTLQALNNYRAFTFAPAGVKLAPISSGFQNAFGNLGFGARFGKRREIEMYFELYMDTWNHPSQTYGHEGYIVIHDIPSHARGLNLLHLLFAVIDLKVGQFEINYGDQGFHRSNNGNVKLNPLVGNYVMDPNTTEIGGEVYTKFNKINFLVGVSTGTSTENFVQGHGTAWHAKLWYTPVKPLRISASYYTVNHARTPATGGAVSTFFSGNRSGARYQSVLNGNPGITPQLRKDVTAWQGDIGWNGDRFYVYGHYGQVWDDDINAARAILPPRPVALKESWKYYAAEGAFNVTKNFYLAARFSGAHAMKIAGVSSDGKIERIQAGMGYHVSKHLLVKVEYVDQQYNDFRTNEPFANLQAWKSPGYHGAVAEFALYF